MSRMINMYMSKYGFEYFNQRITTLNEMARLWTPLLNIKDKGPIANAISDYVGKVMKKGGELTIKNPNGTETVEEVPALRKQTLVNRKLRYFIYMMEKMYKNDYSSSDFLPPNFESLSKAEQEKYEGNDVIFQRARDILGLDPTVAYKKQPGTEEYPELYASGVVYRAAIVKRVKESSYPSSKEFKELAENNNTILEFAKLNRITQNSAYSIRKAAEVESKYSVPLQEHDKLLTFIGPIIRKINIQTRANLRIKDMAKYKSAKAVKEMKSASPSNVNIDTENVATLMAAIDNIDYYRNRVEEIIKDEKKKNKGAKVSDILINIHNNYSNIPLPFLKELRSNTQLNQFFNELKQIYSNISNTGASYDEIISQLNSLKNKKINAVIDMLVQEFNDLLKNIEQTASELGVATGEVSELVGEYPEYQKEVLLKFLDTPEKKAAFDQWYNQIYLVNKNRNISELENQLNALDSGESIGIEGGEDDGEEQEETIKESYVMGYMTEQVCKDRFRTKGEFKDRGFQKARNYSEWMWANSRR